MYALAAVIVDDRGLAELTRTMENLRYRKNVRVHWRLERRDRRPRLIDELAATPLSSVVTVSWDVANAHPALWAADCVVGLVTGWLGGEHMHGGLERRITVIDVDAP